MANFIAVPAADLEAFLQKRLFVRGKQGNEVVYTRHSTVDPHLHIKVYTSIREGQTAVRAAGRDAIRVCAVWDNKLGKNFGVGRFQPVFRVHSVESVLERLEIRLKEAAQRCKDWLGEQASNREAQEDARQKAEYARLERERERAAFQSEAEHEAALEAARSNPRDPKFAAYAATFEVPF